MRALLANYEQVLAQIDRYSQLVGSPRETFFWHLTLELGVKVAQAQLEWAESVIRRIQTKEIPAD